MMFLIKKARSTFILVTAIVFSVSADSKEGGPGISVNAFYSLSMKVEDQTGQLPDKMTYIEFPSMDKELVVDGVGLKNYTSLNYSQGREGCQVESYFHGPMFFISNIDIKLSTSTMMFNHISYGRTAVKSNETECGEVESFSEERIRKQIPITLTEDTPFKLVLSEGLSVTLIYRQKLHHELYTF